MTVVVTPRSDVEQRLWRLVGEVATLFAALPWVVIGGVMVRILEAEHGITVSPFVTGDLDAVLDLRARAASARAASDRLLDAGFTPQPNDRDIAYRFVRNGDVVDLLVPDNLGARADRTTVPPSATIEADGSTQALRRARTLRIDAGEGAMDLPVPDLLGAVVVKAAALESVADREEQAKHRRDLVRLLRLVADPFALAAERTPGERRRLRVQAVLAESNDPAWTTFEDGERARAALLILST